MPEVLEAVMIICFGASWPFNVIKSYKSKTTKGKSLSFLCFIITGYIAGIISKLTNPSYMGQLQSKWYVLFFYCLNLIMVVADFVLYFYNRGLDAQ